MANGGFDLNLLIPLRALLEEANVTRAGQRVNLGQSSMSSALSRLRVAFNDELLVRVGRDYELTPFARMLLPHLQAAIPLMERVLSKDAVIDPRTTERTITVMATDYGVVRLHTAIAELLRDAPGIHVEVLDLPEHPMESERELMTHDFVLSVPGIGIDGRSEPLFDDDYVCLLDRAHPAIAHGSLSLEDFIAAPRAVAQFGRHHFTPADRHLRELGIHPRKPRVTTASYLPLPSVVAGTDLVAVVPRWLAETMGPDTGTVGVDAPFGSVGISLRLFWHESHDADPVHVWFRERLVATLGSSADAAPVAEDSSLR